MKNAVPWMDRHIRKRDKGMMRNIEARKKMKLLRFIFNDGLFSGIKKNIKRIPTIPVLELTVKPTKSVNAHNKKY